MILSAGTEIFEFPDLLKREVIKILNSAGFTLSKWFSNLFKFFGSGYIKKLLSFNDKNSISIRRYVNVELSAIRQTPHRFRNRRRATHNVGAVNTAGRSEGHSKLVPLVILSQDLNDYYV